MAAAPALVRSAVPSPAGPTTPWRTEGNQWLGLVVRRWTKGKGIDCKVVKWVAEDEDDQALWHVLHDDGDEEDLDEQEVRKAIADMANAKREEKKKETNKEKYTCRKGHTLVQAPVTEEELTCDECKDTIKSGCLYSCQPCDYDRCDACNSRGSSGSSWCNPEAQEDGIANAPSMQDNAAGSSQGHGSSSAQYARTGVLEIDEPAGDGFYETSRREKPLKPLSSYQGKRPVDPSARSREVLLVELEGLKGLKGKGPKGKPLLEEIDDLLSDAPTVREKHKRLSREVYYRLGGGDADDESSAASLLQIQEELGSRVVPLHKLLGRTPVTMGVCRHRALLYKVRCLCTPPPASVQHS